MLVLGFTRMSEQLHRLMDTSRCRNNNKLRPKAVIKAAQDWLMRQLEDARKQVGCQARHFE